MVKKKERRAVEAALDAKVLAAMQDVRRAYESRSDSPLQAPT